MKSKLSIKQTAAGALAALAMLAGAVGFVAAGAISVASAQETIDEDGSIAVQWFTGDAYVEPQEPGKRKTKAKAKGGATPEQICEAEERTEARWQKWLAEGVPEQFGSEEPFTFDRSVC